MLSLQLISGLLHHFWMLMWFAFKMDFLRLYTHLPEKINSMSSHLHALCVFKMLGGIWTPTHHSSIGQFVRKCISRKTSNRADKPGRFTSNWCVKVEKQAGFELLLLFSAEQLVTFCFYNHVVKVFMSLTWFSHPKSVHVHRVSCHN